MTRPQAERVGLGAQPLTTIPPASVTGAAASRVSLSRLLGRRLADMEGQPLGRLADVIVRLRARCRLLGLITVDDVLEAALPDGWRRRVAAAPSDAYRRHATGVAGERGSGQARDAR